jgi:hypothetical protein
MSMSNEILEALRELGSVLLDSDVILTMLGAGLLFAIGTVVSYCLGVIAAAVVPSMPTTTAVHSFHCLMQLVRCFP